MTVYTKILTRPIPSPEEKNRFERILDGAFENEMGRKPRQENEGLAQYRQRQHIDYCVACSLAMIIENLTSANKNDRERAKKRVRELVKRGEIAASSCN